MGKVHGKEAREPNRPMAASYYNTNHTDDTIVANAHDERRLRRHARAMRRESPSNLTDTTLRTEQAAVPIGDASPLADTAAPSNADLNTAGDENLSNEDTGGPTPYNTMSGGDCNEEEEVQEEAATTTTTTTNTGPASGSSLARLTVRAKSKFREMSERIKEKTTRSKCSDCDCKTPRGDGSAPDADQSANNDGLENPEGPVDR